MKKIQKKKYLIGANNKLHQSIKEGHLREGDACLGSTLNRKPRQICNGFLSLLALQFNLQLLTLTSPFLHVIFEQMGTQ